MSEPGNAVSSDDLLFVESLHDGSNTSCDTKKEAVARCEASTFGTLPYVVSLLADKMLVAP
jgi:hypothetical protein